MCPGGSGRKARGTICKLQDTGWLRLERLAGHEIILDIGLDGTTNEWLTAVRGTNGTGGRDEHHEANSD